MLDMIEVCAGIGGISLGFEATGAIQTVAFVERDDYACKILRRHWPHVPLVREIGDASAWTLPRCDILAGGIPCQPHSLAGKRGASADERDLWPEFYRLLCELRPAYGVAENVPGLRSSDDGRFFGAVLADLARAGYDAEWVSLSAADVGAPHLRERVWIVAYPQRIFGNRLSLHEGASHCEAPTQSARWLSDGRCRRFADGQGIRRVRWVPNGPFHQFVDGVPPDAHAVRCLGNAVVPECARVIGDHIAAHARRIGLLPATP